MSAVTLAFSHAADFQPLVIFGPATPINEQLDQANDWAGKEIVPVAGITRLEVWTATGIRARYNFPDHAAVDSETPWGVRPPVEATEVIADLQSEIESLKAEIETLKAEKADLPPPAAPEQPTLTLPPEGGPAKPKAKAAKPE